MIVFSVIKKNVFVFLIALMIIEFLTFVGDGFEPFFMLSFRLLLLLLLLSFAAYLLMNDKTFSYFFY